MSDPYIGSANKLHAIISDEQYMYKSPDRLRLPLIFYMAHTASVYINKLLLAGLIKVSNVDNTPAKALAA